MKAWLVVITENAIIVIDALALVIIIVGRIETGRPRSQKQTTWPPSPIGCSRKTGLIAN